MKKAKKILALVVSALLLMSLSVVGTLAYLTKETNTLTNTFTAGNVSFDQDAGLDESNVDEYGKPTTGRTTKGNEYKLVPGHEYTKDPIVHLGDESEEAWIFVKVINGIADIEVAAGEGKTIHEQIISTTYGWVVIDTDADGNYIYGYPTKVKAGGDVPVFGTFTLAGDADVADYVGESITIQAYAVQADTIADVQTAWTLAPLEAWGTVVTAPEEGA